MRMRLTAIALLVLVALPIGAHWGVERASRVEAPRVSLPSLTVARSAEVARAGRSFVRHVGKILEVSLRGSPEEIGKAHSLLLHDEMVETERVVWRLLDDKVPNRWARLLILD